MTTLDYFGLSVVAAVIFSVALDCREHRRITRERRLGLASGRPNVRIEGPYRREFP